MQAIKIKQFVKNLDELSPSSVHLPDTSPSNSLLVRTTHAACTHVDLLCAQGLHQNNRRHVKPPFILGTEFAGVVAFSSSGSKFPVGTRVFGSSLGAYAEHIAVSEASVRAVPVAWTNAEACAVGASGAISYGALVDVAKLKAGESVLVLGASGGLGVMAMQIAAARGARVVAVVGSRDKADLVRRLGADGVVDYNEKGWENKVMELTPKGEGVDIVFDPIGAVENGLKCLKYGGRVVIVGFAGRGGQMEEVKMNRILLKGATVVGYRFGEQGRRAPRQSEALWNEFMALSESGQIKPVIYDVEYRGLGAISRALRDMEARKPWGRSIITINEEGQSHGRAKM